MAETTRKAAKVNGNGTAEIRAKLREMRKGIGKKIRLQRKKRDMDTKILARKIGLSQGSVSNIEKGRQSVTAERLWQIALALGCTPNDLLPPVPDNFKDYEENLRKLETSDAEEFAKSVILSSDSVK